MYTKNEPEGCNDFDDEDDEPEVIDCADCGGFEWDDIARKRRCKGVRFTAESTFMSLTAIKDPRE
jgi:hypothetical protein